MELEQERGLEQERELERELELEQERELGQELEQERELELEQINLLILYFYIMPTLEISQETYEKIKDQLQEEEQVDISSLQDFIGKKVFIRTVTYHVLGEVTKITGNLMFLKNASWIADSGRFADFIKNGEASEAEPVGNWFVNVQSIVDGCIWKHALLAKQK